MKSKEQRPLDDGTQKVVQEVDIIKTRYGKRYALEWFVRFEDIRVLRQTKHYTDKKCRKITILAATNMVITGLLILILILMHYKYQ